MQKKKPIHRDVPDDEDEPVISEQDVEPKKWVSMGGRRQDELPVAYV